jgi:hypothetical protein
MNSIMVEFPFSDHFETALNPISAFNCAVQFWLLGGAKRMLEVMTQSSTVCNVSLH